MTKEKVRVFEKNFNMEEGGRIVIFGFDVLEVLGMFVAPHKFQL